MIKLRRPTLALLLALAPAAAFADDYRWDVNGRFNRDFYPSDFPAGDPDTLNLSATWYFAPVSTEGVPLVEAAFLGRASHLSAIAARFEVFGAHLNAQGAMAGYYLPGDLFYASAGVSRGESITALNSTIVLTEYHTRWFGTVGVTPLAGLLITTDFHEDGYDPNLTARHVGKLPNGRFYAGSVSIIDPDLGDTSFGMEFDYYLDPSTSLGVGYGHAAERWEVRAEKFFARTWALGASAYTNDFGEGLSVHVTWRH